MNKFIFIFFVKMLIGFQSCTKKTDLSGDWQMVLARDWYYEDDKITLGYPVPENYFWCFSNNSIEKIHYPIYCEGEALSYELRNDSLIITHGNYDEGYKYYFNNDSLVLEDLEEGGKYIHYYYFIQNPIDTKTKENLTKNRVDWTFFSAKWSLKQISPNSGKDYSDICPFEPIDIIDLTPTNTSFFSFSKDTLTYIDSQMHENKYKFYLGNDSVLWLSTMCSEERGEVVLKYKNTKP